ncbi:hypothetical protein SEA_NOSILAM_91 [Gordonia phage NosilaM]|uniref:Uncharacterized protein n=1 Tax=Gordonia phage NosilaM TaxID=2507863 RepID=A0A410TE85_9CAUD|nr:hypothetical protein KNU46_gp91 [Gordonia phage NosilaM]QAU07332.1 hypothetical protein SEA_NOSILAM_91 [Gordonia phage NosilaM]
MRIAFGEDIAHGLESVARGYVDALCWTQPDYYGDGDDNGDGEDRTLRDLGYGYGDLHPGTRDRITAELSAVVAAHPLAVRMYGAARTFNAGDGDVWEHFGHDYLLTRDGHGAGFWDRGLGDLGEYLSTIAGNAGDHVELWRDANGLLTDGDDGDG